MKISVIIPSFYPAVVYGGTIFSSLYTCRALANIGYEVYVSTTNTNRYGRLNVVANRWIPMDGFQVKYYQETKVGSFSIALLTGLWKDIRKADVVHVQAIFNTPTPAALFYAWLWGKPVLLSPRGVLGDWIMHQGNPFKYIWLNVCIKPFVQKVVWHATSDQEKQEIQNHFPKARVEVIPNGIDTDLYNKAPYLTKTEYISRFTHRDISSDHIIVSMGRIHKKKGFDILIKSMIFVRCEYPDAILLIAGQDEGDLGHLEELIVSLNLTDVVFMIGQVKGPDKVDFLIHADVFALSSHNENFGNVYAEALASGTPVVASIYTPWQDVEAAGCGKWVDTEETQVGMAILNLLKQDKTEQSRRCKSYIRQFSWEQTGKSMERILKELSNG